MHSSSMRGYGAASARLTGAVVPDGMNPFRKFLAGVGGAGSGNMNASTLSMLLTEL